jgi:DNA-binding NarL/FixJ family response regulator
MPMSATNTHRQSPHNKNQSAERSLIMGTSILAQSPPKHNRIIAWLTGILTLLLATFSFILSFNALTDLATQHGVSIPPLFPFVVEFAVIIFSLNALYRSLSGESAKWQWCLIIGSSLLAGMFNVIHAESDPVSKVMAAMPSLFLLLSFESSLSLVKHGVTRQGINQSITQMNQQVKELDTVLAQKAEKVSTLSNEVNNLVAQIHTLEMQKRELESVSIAPNATSLTTANDTRMAQINERREQVLSLIQQNMSQADIASELNVSLATVKRDAKALNGKVSVIP